ncbi:hypothetical protein HN450_03755 [bacterium]|jgi:DNA sulfur modification protein DndE|nr:hypothetical protein [bacterium]MBT3850424.1 hypothetical protein [bacterium]
MINENKCIDFKSIQIPFPLWQRLGRVASNTGITRNLILRMGFCYRIEQVKGLSEDRAVNQADTKTISKDVLFADYSELFFDLFYIWLGNNADIKTNDELGLFKSLIIEGGNDICNKLLDKQDEIFILNKLKTLITEDD